MMNPFKLIKQAQSGDLTMDQLAESLSVLGIDADFEMVDEDKAFPEFDKLVTAASLPHARLIRLTLTLKAGKFHGLLVMSPADGNS